MKKEEKVINYYVLCNKLKNVIRTGWTDWNVQRDRIESIAEHIYGTQMLAIAMQSEYEYDIDIMKVIYMIAIHELGEILIGDLTSFEITRDEKRKIEHEAVHKILENLIDKEKIEEIFLEFDEHKTKEANFAYQCDKLECDLQCKLYDEEGCVDIHNQKKHSALENERVQELLRTGESWSSLWIRYDLEIIPYDENFREVAKYAKNNIIGK